MILAKPTINISLEDHTNNVIKEAQVILESLPTTIKNYYINTKQNLKEPVLDSCKYHDLGKSHSKWQIPCRQDYELYKENNDPNKLKYLKNASFRHEIASLTHKEVQELSHLVKISIAAHHSHLSFRKVEKWDSDYSWNDKFYNAINLFEGFKKLNTSVQRYKPRNKRFNKAIYNRYKFSGPRSLLQFADHRASAKEMNEEIPDIKKFIYEFKYDKKRGVQRLIDELKDEPFSIIRAETGSGKTDAALLWAKNQIENKKAERLVIAMPTRFTANSLAISNTENLSSLGLYHSTSWFNKDAEQKDAIKEQELARLLFTPTTVTTIDHLLMSLTGTREDHHTIFFNLANSCVVIDEADFYDEFTQQNILVLLKVLSILKVPVLLMSATIPNTLSEIYQRNYYSNNIKECLFESKENLNVSKFKLSKFGEYNKPEELKHLLLKGLDKPLIIYTNTVKKAQSFYKWFLEYDCDFTKENVILYHSRFTDPDKSYKEKELTKRLGKEAWEKDNAFGVAILTQIGELSVNISADIMISDLCPLDRLIQRAGRLSRFRIDPGELFLIKPMKKKESGVLELYPAPYGKYNLRNHEWDNFEILNKTYQLLDEKTYTNFEIFELVNKIYSNKAFDNEEAIVNKEKLEKMIKQNWLILPKDESDLDDEGIVDWRTRNIGGQINLYANVNDITEIFINHFNN